MVLILAIIYVVFISLGLPDSLFGVTWPVVHTDFGIAESFASVYSIVTGICSGGAGLFAGTFIRKFGTPRVTLASILLTAAGLLGISFSPNIWVMMFFTIVLGFGAGAIDTGLNNYVSLHYEARHMSWLHCFWGVGVTASPIIMSAFLAGESGGWRNGYRVIAVIQTAIAVAVTFCLRKWIKADSKTALENEKSEKNSQNGIFSKPGIITSILSLGLYCSMEFLLGTWGASYIVNTLSFSPDAAARWVSFYYGGIMLGRLISGFISMKASDKAMIRGGAALSLMGIIVLALPLGKASLIGLLLIGTGFGPIFPSVLHSVPERFGSKFSADITGYHMGGAYTIGFTIQLAFGYIATATTFEITPFVLAALSLLMIAANEITLRTLAKNKNKS